MLFDLKASARPTATAGRRGEGPGEFSRIANIGWMGSTLWVTDGNKPRAEFFDVGGRVLGSKLFVATKSSVRQATYAGPSAVLRDTGAVYFPSMFLGPAGVPPGIKDAAVPILLAKPGASALDTLGLIRPFRSVLAVEGDRGSTVGSQPFVASDFLKVGAEGQSILVVVQSGPGVEEGRVQVRVYAAAGARLLETDLGLRGQALTARTWDSVLTRSAKSYARDVWSSEGLARTGLQQLLVRPRFLPVIVDAVLGRDGTMWFRRGPSGSQNAEWLVLSSSGRKVGIVKLPASTRVLDVTSTAALGVSRDADDLEYPFWMRVTPP
ncbi:MAG: hypothetical protein KBF28_11415 [Gemmatimonadales bacterium]|nr:hypothetical protein [Gemmatimonadales bacterium]